jgi:hypothetical protein
MDQPVTPRKRPITNSSSRRNFNGPNQWETSDSSDNDTQEEPQWKAKHKDNNHREEDQQIADTIRDNAKEDADLQNEIDRISDQIGRSTRWKTKLNKLATAMGVSFDPKAKREEAIRQVATAALL